MNKHFIAVALNLSLVFLAPAQSNRVMYRDGDDFKGLVKSVRSEAAPFSIQNGERVEGPRTLIQLRNYSADGRQCESIIYKPDGSQHRREVLVYNSAGRLSEKATYNEADSLLLKQLNSFDEGGRITAETTYDENGILQQKKLLIYNSAKDMLLEIQTYDGKGVMFRRDINSYDYANNKSVWHTEDLNGMRSEQTFDLGHPDLRLQESVDYHPNGAVASRSVSSADSPVQRIEETKYDAGGALLRKTSVKREFDSRRNVIKISQLSWNEETKASEPYFIIYNSISYY